MVIPSIYSNVINHLIRLYHFSRFLKSFLRQATADLRSTSMDRIRPPKD